MSDVMMGCEVMGCEVMGWDGMMGWNESCMRSARMTLLTLHRHPVGM